MVWAQMCATSLLCARGTILNSSYFDHWRCATNFILIVIQFDSKCLQRIWPTGIITHDIIHGSVNSERFIEFLWDQVIPLTNPYPGPQSVLVLDNCNIHYAEAVQELVEDEALCKLIFLPPYSPDFNPIKEAFSSIKAYLCRHCGDQSLLVMDKACHNVTAKAAEGFFRSCGYVV